MVVVGVSTTLGIRFEGLEEGVALPCIEPLPKVHGVEEGVFSVQLCVYFCDCVYVFVVEIHGRGVRPDSPLEVGKVVLPVKVVAL